ncbi:M1 family metallopeptidase [Altererythrobacter aquiaggeris]|uniref:M1 family metallopeptidase n=1 Tax=Aestuarierythrobacter aquiaggeris TaxID=1898396 RepID=UPI00301AC5A3
MRARFICGVAASCLALGAVAPAASAQEVPVLAARTQDSGLPLSENQLRTQLPYLALSLKVNPATRSIIGRADYQIMATDAVTRAEFDLDPRYDISAITVDGKTLAKTGWSNPDGFLSITLPKRLAAGETARVSISYAGTPHVAVRAPWDGGFVWDKTPSGADWISTAIQMQGCDIFWPCMDHPTREVGVLDSSITVPAPLVAAGNGVLQSVEQKGDWTTYNWRAKNPNSYGVSLNIAPYELLEFEYKSRFGNTIPVKYWHLPESAGQAPVLMAEMPIYLDFFEELIGPYPFADEKVGVAETSHLGMEHQTINAYGNQYRPTPEGYDTLMQHEFAHEWFANQLSNAESADMWLHEGFGAYMQPLYLLWKDGELAYHADLWQARKGLINRFPVAPRERISSTKYLDGEAGWGRDIYAKGSWVLHTLREHLGNENFFKATTRLVYGRDDPKPGNFVPVVKSTDDFLAIVNDVTGKDFGWFFETYLRSAELPKLVENREGKILNLEWQAPGGTFPMPVEVLVDGRTIVVPMGGGKGSLDLGSATVHYIADPKGKILKDDPDITRWQEWLRSRERGQRP